MGGLENPLETIVGEPKKIKTSSDYHIKTCQSLKLRAVRKIPRNIFLGAYTLFLVGSKIKP